MKRSVWIALTLALAAFIPVGASTFLALSPEELVAQSDAVIQGRVLKVNSFWTPSGRLIVSEAMVQVEETVAGRAPGVVTLRTAGGTVGGLTVKAHGFPSFEVGDRVLLFVTGAQGTAAVTGYLQGQYRVARDKAGVEMAVPTMGEGVRLLHRDGTPAAAAKAVQLDAFKAQIRERAERIRPLEN